MTEEPITKAVSGTDLIGAAYLMASYFDALEQEPMVLAQAARDFAENVGMGEDFHDASNMLASARAVDILRGYAGLVPGPQDLIALPCGDILLMIAAAYMHGTQVGALAGVGLTHPETPTE